MIARHATYSKAFLLAMTPETHAKLVVLARKTGRTMSDLAREAIARLLADYHMLDIHATSDSTMHDHANVNGKH